MSPPCRRRTRQDDDDPLLDLPGFRIGKRGIEKAFDAQVRGSAGASRVEVNAYGRVIRELGRDPGVPGKDVYLTIDNEVQKFAGATAWRRERGLRGHGCGEWRCARDGVDARLRPQRVQCRHHRRRNGRR